MNLHPRFSRSIQMKKQLNMVLLILMLLAAALLISGCHTTGTEDETSGPDTEDESVTLRLLWNDESNVFMDRLVHKVIREFEREHDNVTIELETLPEDRSSRDIFFKQIRTEIMAGKGPDLFLMPTYGVPGNLLFPDVTQAMYNGIFADLSAYYDADADLGKESLNAVVMDAGVVDGCRYTLPLRYDFPVVYANPEQLEAAGLDAAVFDGSVTDVLEAIAELGDQDAAASAAFLLEQNVSALMGSYVNYAREEILLDRTAFIDFWNSYTAVRDVAKGTASDSNNTWFEGYYLNETWLAKREPLRIHRLNSCIMEAVQAKAAGAEIEMYPLRDIDGDLTAIVEYYGAVGAGCAYPELAYAFLRKLLSEDRQWERNIYATGCHMMSRGYAVRDVNSAAAYYEVLKEREVTVRIEGWQEREERLHAVEVTEADVPILQVQIDSVRYPIMEQEYNVAASIETRLQNSNFDAGQIDVEEIVDNFLRDLQFHLSEG